MKPGGQGRILETSLLAPASLSMTFILTFWKSLSINPSMFHGSSCPGYIIPADVNVFDKGGYSIGSHSGSRPKVLAILLSWSFFHCLLLWRMSGWNPKPYQALWCTGFKALTIPCRCLPKPLLARAPLPTVNLTPILVFLDNFGTEILFPSVTKVALTNSRDRKEHFTASLLTSRYGASAEIDATMSSSDKLYFLMER